MYNADTITSWHNHNALVREAEDMIVRNKKDIADLKIVIQSMEKQNDDLAINIEKAIKERAKLVFSNGE